MDKENKDGLEDVVCKKNKLGFIYYSISKMTISVYYSLRQQMKIELQV